MKLHYRTQGNDDGTPVIILHGLFGDGLNWGGVARILKDNYRVILPDLRNHGRSPHDNDDCTYTTMAQDVSTLMIDLGLDSAHIVGHSMGGKVAMILALGQPERVRSLTVVDIAPKVYSPRHQDVFAALKAVAEAPPESRQEAEALLRPHLETDAVRTFIMKNLERTDGYFAWRLNWRALWDHYPDLIDFPRSDGQYEGPVQFLTGGESDYVSAQDQALIRQFFPNAQSREIAGTGHWLHAEKPELVARWIEEFITG